jgi:hypothetical protein
MVEEMATWLGTWTHRRRQGNMDEDRKRETGNGKRKPRRFFSIRLPFAHRANGSLSFVLLCEETKRKLPVCKRTYILNVLNGLAHLCRFVPGLLLEPLPNQRCQRDTDSTSAFSEKPLILNSE